jgi:hypothetical protein
MDLVIFDILLYTVYEYTNTCWVRKSVYSRDLSEGRRQQGLANRPHI